jgi:integrative and conjugative element protein (TIGR02256 family)
LINLQSLKKKDKQTRNSFYRSSKHNELVQKIWKKTNGFSTFLGLWHTHPENVPHNSSIDKKDWLDSLLKSKYEKDCLFFLIIGRSHIRCWVGLKDKVTLLGEYRYD